MFPFCIPIDVYNIFNALIATPVEPRFEFDILPFINADTTIVLEFSQFETIRQLVRAGMLIAFIIGLTVSTRKYIWTGGG
jgi:DNA-binding transcriptional LysR family regulator